MPQLEQLPALICDVIKELNEDLTGDGATMANAPESLRDRFISVKALADAFGANCPDVAPLPSA